MPSFLCQCPEPLRFQLLLPSLTFFSRVLGDQSLGVDDVLHVILRLYFFVLLHFLLPILERALVKAEIGDADRLTSFKRFCCSQVVLSLHLSSIFVAQDCSLTGSQRHKRCPIHVARLVLRISLGLQVPACSAGMRDLLSCLDQAQA